MKLSLRIPLVLTIIVVVTGIIAIIKRSASNNPFSTATILIWAFVSAILIGITTWSWMQGKKNY